MEYETDGLPTPLTPNLASTEAMKNVTNITSANNATSAQWQELGAYYLFVVASVGGLFNFLIIMSIFCCKSLRRMTNAFIIHQCVIDIAKCALCIPFATSLLQKAAPNFCDLIAATYVILVSVSTFNLLAMVATEAYTFRDIHLGEDAKGTACCVLFGILMVYIGSIIIHLGPTLIGGTFAFNESIGNCIFAYGEIKNYVIHCIWITIVSFSLLLIFYYLGNYYRTLRSNEAHRVATLIRNAAAYSKGKGPNASVHDYVQNAISRARIYIVITATFIICWYPLFILTLADRKFEQSADLYRLLSLLAWTNATITPIILLFFDKSFSVFCHMSSCCRSRSQIPNRDESSMTLMRDSSTMSSQAFERVQQANRMFREEQPQAGPSTCNGNSPERQVSVPAFVPCRLAAPMTHYYFSDGEDTGH